MPFEPSDESQPEFLALIDTVLARMSVDPPHLSGSIPWENLPNDPPERIVPHCRLSMRLEGTDVHVTSVRGQRVEVAIKPGTCVYWAPYAANMQLSFTVGYAFQLAVLPECVRLMRYICAPETPDQPYSRRYHTSLPLSGAAMQLVHVLNSHAEQGETGPESRLLVLALVHMVRRHLQLDEPTPHDWGRAGSRWSGVLAYLEENFHYGMSREIAAAANGLHPNYLSALARRMTGAPFRDVLEAVRMRNARRLLQETDMKLARIAGLCGYQNPFYFSRAFRRAAGTTPGRFRSQPNSGKG